MSETHYDREAYARYSRGDRDQEAKNANAAYSRLQRARADENIRLIRVGTALSEREKTALTTRLDELGVTESEYVRDVILAALGIEDTARRPAPKRPRRHDSKQQGSER